MSRNQIIEIYDQPIPHRIKVFMEAVADMDLYFTAESLMDIYRTKEELRSAIDRAMHICNSIGLPLEQHFRRRYISDNIHHIVLQDWKMSKLAYCLTLVNGDPDNPAVGRIQLELLKRILER